MVRGPPPRALYTSPWRSGLYTSNIPHGRDINITYIYIYIYIYIWSVNIIYIYNFFYIGCCICHIILCTSAILSCHLITVSARDHRVCLRGKCYMVAAVVPKNIITSLTLRTVWLQKTWAMESLKTEVWTILSGLWIVWRVWSMAG